MTKQIVTAKQLFNVTDRKAPELFQAIGKAKRRAESLNKYYQRIAISLLQHVWKHGDITVIRKFIDDDTSESMHKGTMIAFFCKYGQVRLGVDKDGNEILKYDKQGKLDVAGALSNAWWTCKKENVYEGYDLLAKIEAIIKQAENKIKNPREGDVVALKDLQALRSIRDSYKGDAVAVVDQPIQVSNERALDSLVM